MLDTIILTIPKNDFCILDDKFKPLFDSLKNAAGFAKCVNNPAAEDKKLGIYKPRLTALKRRFDIGLKIEFSAPKLLFGDNVNELGEKDFDNLIAILATRIKEMGVGIFASAKTIENAPVSGFHASKNIVLTRGYTAGFAIRELSKINLNQKLDLEKTTFRNSGESLQFYANRHALVFYDKIIDLAKPEKRAIDKDQTSQQFSLFDYIKQNQTGLELLRMETRLSHKTKMNEILQKVGYAPNPAFKDIFKKEVCQKVLKLYWNKFFEQDGFLFSVNNSPQKILQLIFKKYPNTKPKTAVFLSGLMTLCKDDEGIRGLRSIVNPKNWTPLRNYLRKFENDIFRQPQHGFIKDIETALAEFKPYKLPKSYPHQPLVL